MYPEFTAAARADEGLARRSAGRGRRRDLAKRFGWKIGDRIPIQGTIWRPKNGGSAWEFNIVGIYDGEPGVDKTQFFFRYDYLDENRRERRTGTVGWYIVKIDGPVAVGGDGGDVRRHVRQLAGRNEDDDREGVRRGLRQAGRRHRRDHDRDSRRPCCSRCCWSSANTMAQAVRERTSELAVLKTLGFSNGDDAGARARRVDVHRAARRRARPAGVRGLIVQRGDPTGGLLPVVLPADAGRGRWASG